MMLSWKASKGNAVPSEERSGRSGKSSAQKTSLGMDSRAWD